MISRQTRITMISLLRGWRVDPEWTPDPFSDDWVSFLINLVFDFSLFIPITVGSQVIYPGSVLGQSNPPVCALYPDF
jgi:hypothetical protein